MADEAPPLLQPDAGVDSQWTPPDNPIVAGGESQPAWVPPDAPLGGNQATAPISEAAQADSRAWLNDLRTGKIDPSSVTLDQVKNVVGISQGDTTPASRLWNNVKAIGTVLNPYTYAARAVEGQPVAPEATALLGEAAKGVASIGKEGAAEPVTPASVFPMGTQQERDLAFGVAGSGAAKLGLMAAGAVRGVANLVDTNPDRVATRNAQQILDEANLNKGITNVAPYLGVRPDSSTTALGENITPFLAPGGGEAFGLANKFIARLGEEIPTLATNSAGAVANAAQSVAANPIVQRMATAGVKAGAGFALGETVGHGAAGAVLGAGYDLLRGGVKRLFAGTADALDATKPLNAGELRSLADTAQQLNVGQTFSQSYLQGIDNALTDLQAKRAFLAKEVKPEDLALLNTKAPSGAPMFASDELPKSVQPIMDVDNQIANLQAKQKTWQGISRYNDLLSNATSAGIRVGGNIALAGGIGGLFGSLQELSGDTSGATSGATFGSLLGAVGAASMSRAGRLGLQADRLAQLGKDHVPLSEHNEGMSSLSAGRQRDIDIMNGMVSPSGAKVLVLTPEELAAKEKSTTPSNGFYDPNTQTAYLNADAVENVGVQNHEFAHIIDPLTQDLVTNAYSRGLEGIKSPEAAQPMQNFFQKYMEAKRKTDPLAQNLNDKELAAEGAAELARYILARTPLSEFYGGRTLGGVMKQKVIDAYNAIKGGDTSTLTVPSFDAPYTPAQLRDVTNALFEYGRKVKAGEIKKPAAQPPPENVVPFVDPQVNEQVSLGLKKLGVGQVDEAFVAQAAEGAKNPNDPNEVLNRAFRMAKGMPPEGPQMPTEAQMQAPAAPPARSEAAAAPEEPKTGLKSVTPPEPILSPQEQAVKDALAHKKAEMTKGIRPSPTELTSPAIQLASGEVIPGFTHADAIAAAKERGLDVTGHEKGYETINKDFLPEKQALDYGQNIGQLPEDMRKMTPYDFWGNKQFMPSTHPDAINAVAIKDHDTGRVYAGIPGETHMDLAYREFPNGKPGPKGEQYDYSPGELEELGMQTWGYVDNHGNFLDRKQAWERAKSVGQEVSSSSEERGFAPDELVSEDLSKRRMMPSTDYSWMDRSGRISPVEEGDHFTVASRLFPFSKNPLVEAYKNGMVRVKAANDTLYAQIPREYGGELTHKQKIELINTAIENGLNEVRLDTGYGGGISVWRNEGMQFMPSAHPEAVNTRDGAVIRTPDGKIWSGPTHGMAYSKMTENYSAEQLTKWANQYGDMNYFDGNLYKLNNGQIVDEDTANANALKHGQMTPMDVEKMQAQQRRAGVRVRPMESMALRAAADRPMVNIGLNTADGAGITKEQAIRAIHNQGPTVLQSSVHQSGTEPTLVASLNRPLTPEQAHQAAVEARQQAIVQYHPPVEGATGVFGPEADKWKPFKSEYFLTHEGTPLKDQLLANSGRIGARGMWDALTATGDVHDIAKEIGVPADKHYYEQKPDAQARIDQYFKARGAQYMPATDFYSKAAKAIEGNPQKVWDAEQLKGFLRGKGVSPNEMEWSGINDLSGKLTKEQAIAAINAGMPQVEERIASSKAASINDIAKQMFGNDYTMLNADQKARVGDAFDRIEPQYGEHVLPGGENYRELLMKLPTETPQGLTGAELDRYRQLARRRYTYKGLTKDEIAEFKSLDAKNAESLKSTTKTPFTSSHFEGEPNIIGWSRVDDRPDPVTGGKMLFSQEFQSDWASKGAREGFAHSELPPDFVVRKIKGEEIKGQEWGTYQKDSSGNETRIHKRGFASEQLAKDAALKYINEGAAPDMPFKGNAWKKLVMRNMIKHAVDEGYDSIGWTTGQQQADRYDLSKQVDKITFQKQQGHSLLNLKPYTEVNIKVKGDTRNHNLIVEDGKIVDIGTSSDFTRPMEGKMLSDVLGKDIASKILEGGNSGEITDLKIGGESKSNLYDKELVNIANDIGKKYGARVGDAQIDVNHLEGLSGLDLQKPETVHRLPITDAMRESVQEHGQPMFMPSTAELYQKQLDAFNEFKALRDKGLPGDHPARLAAWNNYQQARKEFVDATPLPPKPNRRSRAAREALAEAQRKGLAMPATEQIPSDDRIANALSANKVPLIGAHRDLPEGTPVSLRIDIPAYNKTGDYVVTVHKGNLGKVEGYDGIAAVDNPTFRVNEAGAEKVKEGMAKYPMAAVNGTFDPTRTFPSDIGDYAQVGFNPTRHSYFYDKDTGMPVVGGDKAISAGNTVYVKNPVYGNAADFRYMPATPKEAKAATAAASAEFPEAKPLRWINGTDGKPKIYRNPKTGKMETRPALETYDFAQQPVAVAAARGIENKDAAYAAKTDAAKDLLVDEYNKVKDNPDVMQAKGWYRELKDKLLGKLGGSMQDLILFTRLLAATSPNTNPGVNFGFTLDAWNRFKRGEYDDLIQRYNDVLAKFNAGELKHADGTPVVGAKQFEGYLHGHDMIPYGSGIKKTGEPVKLGMHSLRVLDTLSDHFDRIKGLKINQFSSNLAQTDLKATIDLWAARTVSRLLNIGNPQPWRILPMNEAGIKAADFHFAQEAFGKAAQEIGISPDDLQAILWFAEKHYYDDQGWSAYIDKGDFRPLVNRMQPAEHKGTFRLGDVTPPAQYLQ